MPYHQRIMLMGVTGDEPEFKVLENGPLCRFSVCVEERWRVQTTGEKKKTVTWFRCSAFERIAEQAKKVLRPGTWVYLEGRIRVRKDPQNHKEYWNVTVDLFRCLSRKPGEEGDELDQRQPEEE